MPSFNVNVLVSELSVSDECELWSDVGDSLKRMNVAVGGVPVIVLLDTACNGHVFRSTESLKTMRVSEGSTITGIGKQSTAVSATGVFPGLPGVVYVATEAKENLISIPRLTKAGCAFSGDKEQMVVVDKNGRLMLKAFPRPDGLFAANLTECMATYLSSEATVNNVAMMNQIELKEHRLNGQDIARATQARRMHCEMGHPGDDAFKAALNNGCYAGVNLTGRDVDNSNIMFGPCQACVEGKMVAPGEPSTDNELPSRIGEMICLDLQHVGADDSLGGNSQMLLGRDIHISYGFAVAIKTKQTHSVTDGLKTIVSVVSSYGHTVTGFLFDSEAVFIAQKGRIPGVRMTYTPPGLHNKRAERFAREVKDKYRTMLAGLDYELPPKLRFEGYAAAVDTINSVPNKQTGPTVTLYRLMSGKRPAPRQYCFGQPGLIHSSRPDSPDVRAEWAIYLGSNIDSPNNLRVYIPSRDSVYSRRKFIPQEGWPAE